MRSSISVREEPHVCIVSSPDLIVCFHALAASQTKLMTAVAAMQCVQRGLIGLDDPVGDICPELSDPDVIEGFDDGGEAVLRKAERKIPLRYELL